LAAAKWKDAEKYYGEWNTVEVISFKGKCVHIVNGVVVNVGEDASVKKEGYYCSQNMPRFIIAIP
jgi:hypothetical protein